MSKEKVKFSKEKETLLITLYCNHLKSQKKSLVVKDEKAIEII